MAVRQGCDRGSLGGLHPVTLPENTAGAMQITRLDVLRHSAGAVVGIGIGEPERHARVLTSEVSSRPVHSALSRRRSSAAASRRLAVAGFVSHLWLTGETRLGWGGMAYRWRSPYWDQVREVRSSPPSWGAAGWAEEGPAQW